MFQNKVGTVLAVIGGVIGLATASGTFNGDKSSAYPAPTYPAPTYPAYNFPQPYANPGYYSGAQPTDANPYDDQLARMEEERINAEAAAREAEIEREIHEWNQYVIEHPAGSVGNPYDQ